MAKANNLFNKLGNQSSKLGGSGGGMGGKGGAGQSELSKLIQAEAKKKGGASGTGHVLNEQLGRGGGSAPHGPAGGSGGAKGVPRRPSTNKGP